MFFDRYDAGERLAERLLHYKYSDSIVYAIPNGGALTGLVIAEKLGLPLELIISRRVSHPLNKEYAICAIVEDGTLVCSEWGLCGVDKDKVEHETKVQRRLATRKGVWYRKNHTPTSPFGKTAIIVDDGVATGLTMRAAVTAIKKQGSSKVVVATPVAHQSAIESLAQLADEVVVVESDERNAMSISDHYKYFSTVFDKDVLVCIQRADQRYGVKHHERGSVGKHAFVS